MRILKKGILPNPPEKIFYEHTCKNCQTLFEIEKSEFRYTRVLLSEFFGYVNCPLCEEACTIAMGKGSE